MEARTVTKAQLDTCVARAATAQSIIQYRTAGAALQEIFCDKNNADYAISRGGIEACVHLIEECPENAPRRQAAFALSNLTSSLPTAQYAAEHQLGPIILRIILRQDADESTAAYLINVCGNIASSVGIHSVGLIEQCQAVAKCGCLAIQHPLLIPYVARYLAAVGTDLQPVVPSEWLNSFFLRCLTNAYLPAQREGMRAVAQLAQSTQFQSSFSTMMAVNALLSTNMDDQVVAREFCRFAYHRLRMQTDPSPFANRVVATLLRLAMGPDPDVGNLAALCLSTLAESTAHHDGLLVLGVQAVILYHLSSFRRNPAACFGCARLLSCLSTSTRGLHDCFNRKTCDLIEPVFAAWDDTSKSLIAATCANACMIPANMEMLINSQLLDSLLLHASSRALVDVSSSQDVKCVLVILVHLSGQELYHHALIHKGAIALTNRFVASSDESIRSLALYSTNNLSRNPDVHDQLFRAGTVQSIVVLLDDKDAAVVRAVLAILTNIALFESSKNALSPVDLAGPLVRLLVSRSEKSVLLDVLYLLTTLSKDITWHEGLLRADLCAILLLQFSQEDDLLLLDPTTHILANLLLSGTGRVYVANCFRSSRSIEAFVEKLATMLQSAQDAHRKSYVRLLSNITSLAVFQGACTQLVVIRALLASVDDADIINSHHALSATANIASNQSCCLGLIQGGSIPKLLRVLKLRSQPIGNRRLACRSLISLCATRCAESSAIIIEEGVVETADGLIRTEDDKLRQLGALLLLSLSWNQQALARFIESPDCLSVIGLLASHKDPVTNKLLASLCCTLSFLPVTRALLMKHHSSEVLQLVYRWMSASDVSIRRLGAALVANLFESLQMPLLHHTSYFTVVSWVLRRETDGVVLLECYRALVNACQRPMGLGTLVENPFNACMLQAASCPISNQSMITHTLANLCIHLMPSSKTWNNYHLSCRAIQLLNNAATERAISLYAANLVACCPIPQVVHDITTDLKAHTKQQCPLWLLNAIGNGYPFPEGWMAALYVNRPSYATLVHFLESAQSAAARGANDLPVPSKLIDTLGELSIPQTLDVQRLVQGIIANASVVRGPLCSALVSTRVIHNVFRPFDSSDSLLLHNKLAAAANVIANQVVSWRTLLANGLVAQMFHMLRGEMASPRAKALLFRCISGVAFFAAGQEASGLGLPSGSDLLGLLRPLAAVDRSCEGDSFQLQAIACVARYFACASTRPDITFHLLEWTLSLKSSGYWPSTTFQRAVAMFLFVLTDSRQRQATKEIAYTMAQEFSVAAAQDVLRVATYALYDFCKGHDASRHLSAATAQVILVNALAKGKPYDTRSDIIGALLHLQQRVPQADWRLVLKGLCEQANNYRKVLLLKYRDPANDESCHEEYSQVLRWLGGFLESPANVQVLRTAGLATFMLAALEESLGSPGVALTRLQWNGMRALNNMSTSDAIARTVATSSMFRYLLDQYQSPVGCELITGCVSNLFRCVEIAQSFLIELKLLPTQLLRKTTTKEQKVILELLCLNNLAGHISIQDVKDVAVGRQLGIIQRNFAGNALVMDTFFECIANLGTWAGIWAFDAVERKALVLNAMRAACKLLHTLDITVNVNVISAVQSVFANEIIRYQAFEHHMLSVVCGFGAEARLQPRGVIRTCATAASLNVLSSSTLRDIIEFPCLACNTRFVQLAFTGCTEQEAMLDYILFGNSKIPFHGLNMQDVEELLQRMHSAYNLVTTHRLAVSYAILNVFCHVIAQRGVPSSASLRQHVSFISALIQAGFASVFYVILLNIAYLGHFPVIRPYLSSLTAASIWSRIESLDEPWLHSAASAAYTLLTSNLICNMQATSTHAGPKKTASPAAVCIRSLLVRKTLTLYHPLFSVRRYIATGIARLQCSGAYTADAEAMYLAHSNAKSATITLASFDDRLLNMLVAAASSISNCRLKHHACWEDVSRVANWIKARASFGDPSPEGSLLRGKGDLGISHSHQTLMHGWVENFDGASVLQTCSAEPGSHEHDRRVAARVIGQSQDIQSYRNYDAAIIGLTLHLMHVSSSKYYPHHILANMAANNLMFVEGFTMQTLMQTLSLWQLDTRITISQGTHFGKVIFERAYRAAGSRGLPLPCRPKTVLSDWLATRTTVYSAHSLPDLHFGHRQEIQLSEVPATGLHSLLHRKSFDSPDACLHTGCFSFVALQWLNQYPTAGICFMQSCTTQNRRFPLQQVIMHIAGPPAPYAQTLCGQCQPKQLVTRPQGFHGSVAFVCSSLNGEAVRTWDWLLPVTKIDNLAAISFRSALDKFLLNAGARCYQGDLPSSLNTLLFLAETAVQHGITAIGTLQFASSTLFSQVIDAARADRAHFMRSIRCLHRLLPVTPAVVLPACVLVIASLLDIGDLDTASALGNMYCKLTSSDSISAQLSSPVNHLFQHAIYEMSTQPTNSYRRTAAVLVREFAGPYTAEEFGAVEWLASLTLRLAGDIDYMVQAVARMNLLLLLGKRSQHCNHARKLEILQGMLAVAMPTTTRCNWDTSIAFAVTAIYCHPPVRVLLIPHALPLLNFLTRTHAFTWSTAARRGLSLSIMQHLLQHSMQQWTSVECRSNLQLLDYLVEISCLPEDDQVRFLLIIAVAAAGAIADKHRARSVVAMFRHSPTSSASCATLPAACAAVLMVARNETWVEAVAATYHGLTSFNHAAVGLSCNAHLLPLANALYNSSVPSKNQLPLSFCIPCEDHLRANTYASTTILLSAVVAGMEFSVRTHGIDVLWRLIRHTLDSGTAETEDIACVACAKLCQFLLYCRPQKLDLSEAARSLNRLEKSPALPPSGVSATLELRRLFATGGVLGKIDDLIR